MSDERDELHQIVETRLGRTPASIEPIEAGLGTRRFYRIAFPNGSPRSLVARVDRESPRPSPSNAGDAVASSQSPTWLPEPPLEPLRSFLAQAGLPVPECPLHLPELGIDLLEDVGDRTLSDADAPARTRLYREACEWLPRMQRLSASPEEIPAFGRVFDRALVQTKAWKWSHWAIPGLLDRQATTRETRAIETAFESIADLLETAPRRLAHRDFKAENLHLVQSADRATARLVMIDIQGAFLAPPEYDLVCLLYDLQVDLDEAFVQATFAAIQPELPDTVDLELARLRFDAIATIRLAKDLAHVVHAGRARDDRRRWHEIPRGLELLGRAAGRLRHTLSEVNPLFSVIQTLTETCKSSDSGFRGHEK
jgi:hypothetical protein